MSVRIETATGRLRIVLDAARGNAITDAMVGTMREALARVDRGVKLVTLEGAGADFSFGSSLDEHTPQQMPAVLPRFNALIMDLLRVPAATAAVVAGRCLGGGFELALACDVIHAADDAVLGLPEIKVGAFPPAGSILLSVKAGPARAARAILSGEPLPVCDWQQAGLVGAVVPREELAASVDRWFAWTLARYSASSLARAAAATRLVTVEAMAKLLPEAERLYLNDLLRTRDAAEGVAAFLEKRAPRWTDA